MESWIELRQLRYFLALCETLNFGRAAQQLHIAQPPLTRQIRQLEAQLGVALFVRSSTGVTLTAAGSALRGEARKTLLQADKAVRAAQAAGAPALQTLRIGYTTVFDASIYPALPAAFARRFPQCRVTEERKHSIQLVRDLQARRLDLAFIGLHTDARKLQTQVLRTEPVVIALASNHPLARRRALRWEALAAEPMFWFQRRLNPGFHDHCDSFFGRIGFAPPRLAEPADHHVLLGQIAAGQGFALVPASMRAIQRKGVAYRPLQAGEPPLHMGIVLAWSPDHVSPALAALLSAYGPPKAP